MKKVTHFRKGNVIRDATTGKDQVFEFINEAKRESRKIQQSGSVMQVVDKFPKDSSAAAKT